MTCLYSDMLGLNLSRSKHLDVTVKDDIMNLGVAILGAGMVAEYHQQAVQAHKDLKLIAIGHHDKSKFAQVSQKFGVPCLSYQEILEHPDINIICLCTPSGQHAKQTIAAARAGKHVLVEKPMALNLQDADAMIQACEQARVTLGVVLQRRAEPLFQHVKAALDAGDLGDLTLGSVTIPYVRDDAYYAQAAWRGTWAQDGGGVLMNQGIHLVDLLIWFMGDPVSVQATAKTLHRNVQVEDTLATTLEFANGSLATITATTTAAVGFPHRLEIYGTKGGIQITGEQVSAWSLLEPESAAVTPVEIQEDGNAGAGGDPRGIKATGHINVMADFVKAIQENRNPHIDGVEGKRSLKTILDIYASATIGGKHGN